MDILAAPEFILNFVLLKVLPFVVVLSVVVFIHEMGHLLIGRWCGVKVEAFSLGFGPELFGFTDKKGTRWRFAAIPLGGYVRFLGDENAASQPDDEAMANMDPSERGQTLDAQPIWQRAAVVAAGPIANFLLAIVLYTGLSLAVEDVTIAPVVGSVQQDSAAQEAGIQPGDRVLAIDDTPIASFQDMQRITMMSSDSPLAFRIERDGKEQTVTAAPRITERTDNFGNSYKTALVGISPDTDPANITYTRLGPVDAFLKGLDHTWLVVSGTGNFLAELFGGKQDASELRGPIGIAQMTSQVATLGILQLLSLTAVLSVSIGLMNLLPVPMLDGGHLVFYALEAIRGKPLSPVAQDRAFKIGLSLVLMLMIFATGNDLIRAVGS